MTKQNLHLFYYCAVQFYFDKFYFIKCCGSINDRKKLTKNKLISMLLHILFTDTKILSKMLFTQRMKCSLSLYLLSALIYMEVISELQEGSGGHA